MQGFVLTGSGSNSDPTRRGSPADGREHVHPTRPGIRTPANPVTAFLRRFDAAFSRTFTAMAMAEDGTRELALEMLDVESDEGSEPPQAESA